MKRFALLLLLSMAAPAPAPAAADQRAAEMLERARALLSAAETPQERLAALGRAAQAQEAVLKGLRADLRAAADRRAGIEAGFSEKERKLIAVLAALQRLERAPRAVALAHPGGPLAAARAGMELAAFAPALEAEATRLKATLSQLAALSAAHDAAAGAARASLGELQRLRAEIAELLDRDGARERLPKDLVERLEAQGAALAASAKSLRAFTSALPPDIGGGEAPRAASFLSARGLAPPAEGALALRYGERNAEGISIETPAYAAVYAPWRSVVRFAGPFGGEGVVVILEPDPGVLIVLSGLASASRGVGEVVLAGEPIGAMGGSGGGSGGATTPDSEEFLIASARPVESTDAQTLYMEVRRGGAPANPATWFAFDQTGR